MRGANDDRRLIAASATDHRDDAGQVQEQENGERTMRHLHDGASRINGRISPAQRNGRARDGCAGNLRRQTA